MTRKLELSVEQEEALLETFRTTEDQRLRDRCQALLMVARGGRTRKAPSPWTSTSIPARCGAG